MVPPWVTYVLMGVGISGLVIAAITLGVNLCLRHRDKPEKEVREANSYSFLSLST